MTGESVPRAAARSGSLQENAFHPIPPSGEPRNASPAQRQKRPREEVRYANDVPPSKIETMRSSAPPWPREASNSAAVTAAANTATAGRVHREAPRRSSTSSVGTETTAVRIPLREPDAAIPAASTTAAAIHGVFLRAWSAAATAGASASAASMPAAFGSLCSPPNRPIVFQYSDRGAESQPRDCSQATAAERAAPAARACPARRRSARETRRAAS